jgi:flagellar biosynthesis protein FlhB
MSEQSGEKTEEPTDKKINDSRKRGQVWKSKDFSGVLMFVAGLGAVKVSWDMIETELAALFKYGFDKVAAPRALEQGIHAALLTGVTTLLLLSIPTVFTTAIIGGLADFLMVGPLFAKDSLTPKLEKLDPIQGLKNLFSKKQLIELPKSVLKMGITAYVVWGVVRDSSSMIVQTVQTSSEGMLAVMGELVFAIAVKISVVFTVFAVFDVWFQHYAYMKDLMMTKDEIKREYKESEGDPHHKAKRREMHMEILEGAQMSAVKKADAIVTNPDHVAIAVRYQAGQDSAPLVLAKGVDAQAEEIKAIARAAGITVVRNVPLARALLDVELGEEIPPSLYDAAAEVLNFVYALEQQQA